jgi:hypothetical protein
MEVMEKRQNVKDFCHILGKLNSPLQHQDKNKPRGQSCRTSHLQKLGIMQVGSNLSSKCRKKSETPEKEKKSWRSCKNNKTHPGLRERIQLRKRHNSEKIVEMGLGEVPASSIIPKTHLSQRSPICI